MAAGSGVMCFHPPTVLYSSKSYTKLQCALWIGTSHSNSAVKYLDGHVVHLYDL